MAIRKAKILSKLTFIYSFDKSQSYKYCYKIAVKNQKIDFNKIFKTNP